MRLRRIHHARIVVTLEGVLLLRGIAVSLVWASGWIALAQSAAPSASIRVDSTLVLVPVTVTDSSSRYVLGLEKQNFRIFEDDVEQKIAQFSGEDAPLSVGLIFDTSGSMGGKLETSREAVMQFLKTMNKADEAFLIEFGDQAELAAGFTGDDGLIDRRLRSAKASGMTALLDAVHLGLREMRNAKNPRKALLIFSDGGDNHSRYTSREIQSVVKEMDVQIFALGVFEPVYFRISAEEATGPALLAEISEQTGGRVFAASSSSDLPNLAATIGIELRNQYMLAYRPANPARDGGYRRLQVTLREPKGLPALKARWRLGYYAPAE